MSNPPRLLQHGRFAQGWVSRHLRGLSWSMFGTFWLIVIALGLTQFFHLLQGPMPTGVEGVMETVDQRIVFTIRWTLLIGLTWLPTLPCLIVALNVESRTTVGRVLALVVAVLLGATAGQAIEPLVGSFIFGWEPTWQSGRSIVTGILSGTLTAGAAAALLYLARRDTEAMEKLHREELDRVALDRQMTEARLRVLQAQIEPHFLFNTLANVQRLYEIDPPSGKSMLQHLRAYLAAALPEMRALQSTLGRELALTVAYLNVQKIRMGQRLAFEVDVPEPLKATSFPAMMLLTLVENAIKHGLASLPEGGSVGIVARQHEGKLQLAVRDDGVGLTLSSGAGVGLANSRMRLATLYGTAARLLLDQNLTRGVTATVELPIDKLTSVRAVT